MSELEGRELDAAIARGLGWEEGRYAWNVPEFHRSLDAIVEHCAPWLRERELRWGITVFEGRPTGWVTGDELYEYAMVATPALALARSVLAAMEARR